VHPRYYLYPDPASEMWLRPLGIMSDSHGSVYWPPAWSPYSTQLSLLLTLLACIPSVILMLTSPISYPRTLRAQQSWYGLVTYITIPID
jgi:hypothetical protein